MVISRQPKVSRLTQLGHAWPLLAALHPRKVRRPVFGNIDAVARGDAAPHRTGASRRLCISGGHREAKP